MLTGLSCRAPPPACAIIHTLTCHDRSASRFRYIAAMQNSCLQWLERCFGQLPWPQLLQLPEQHRRHQLLRAPASEQAASSNGRSGDT